MWVQICWCQSHTVCWISLADTAWDEGQRNKESELKGKHKIEDEYIDISICLFIRSILLYCTWNTHKSTHHMTAGRSCQTKKRNWRSTTTAFCPCVCVCVAVNPLTSRGTVRHFGVGFRFEVWGFRLAETECLMRVAVKVAPCLPVSAEVAQC